MNNTSTPKSHRHFVVAPLAALLLLLQFSAAGSDSLQGELTGTVPVSIAASSPTPVVLPEGTAGVLVEGALTADDAEGVMLRRGSAILASDASLTFGAGSATVSGFHGAIFASIQNDALWVSALSTPVIIRRAGLMTVVPAGFQMTIREGESTLLQLSSESQESLLGTLSSTIDPTLSSSLLAASADHPSAAFAALSDVSDPDVWLLASLHPAYVQAAWMALPPLEFSPHAAVQRLSLFPLADTGNDAVPGFVVDRWADEVSSFLQTEDPQQILSPLLTSLSLARERFVHGDYPERLERYTRLVRSLLVPRESYLSQEDRVLMQPWLEQSMAQDSLVTTPVHAEQLSQRPKAIDAKAAEGHRQALLATLTRLGAVFTTDTVSDVTSEGSIHIRNLAIPSASGLHSYDFTFDPATGMAESITSGDRQFPFAMALEEFVGWAQN